MKNSLRNLLVLSMLSTCANVLAQPPYAQIAKPIEGQLGIDWRMTPDQAVDRAKSELGMRVGDTSGGLIQLIPTKRDKMNLVDTFSFRYDDQGLNFLRIDHSKRASKDVLADYLEKYGEPAEIGFGRYHWVDSNGRWINLFSPRGKQQKHWIGIFSRIPAIMGDLSKN